MNGINTQYRDRVKYTLYHNQLGETIIEEPIGWEDDDKEYVRHKKYHGVLTKLSNSSKYIENGADFINTVFDTYGINEEITLKKEIRHPYTDRWVLDYEGVIDLSKWSSEGFTVKAKFNSSGLQTLLKARESEQIEIERTTTLDGKPLSKLDTHEIEMKGRKVYLESKFEEDTNVQVRTDVPGGNGKFYQIKNIFPLKISSKADELVHTPQEGMFEFEPNASHIFYGPNDRKKVLKISIKGSFTIKPWTVENINSDEFVRLNLFVYKDGNYNLKIGHTVYSDPSPRSTGVRRASFDREIDVVLEEGESMCLCFWTGADLGGSTFGGYGYFRHEFLYPKIDMVIQEDSSFPNTNTKVVLAHELVDRLTNIITGKKNVVHSKYLGRKALGYQNDGNGALKGYACGHWIRGFDKIPERESNKYKPFTTSLKDCLEDLIVTENVGIGIEKKGVSEKLVIEPLEEFYINEVTVKLPYQATNVKRKVAEKHYYSSILIGAAKGWDNEEAMGLDEYNTQSNFVTPITRIKNEFRRITKYIYAPYAGEFIRRKQKLKFPNLDHKNDKEIFPFALTKRGGKYTQRTWHDDLDKKPVGVYSPDTAYNLLYSPVNLLLKHSKFIAGSFIHHLNDVLSFGSSKGNTNLSTKKRYRQEFAENKDIQCSKLGNPLFVPIEVEFEHKFDFLLKEQLEGTSIINGKEVKNIYGLIEFINEKGDPERGYFQSLKPKGKGKWKLLKAYEND